MGSGFELGRWHRLQAVAGGGIGWVTTEPPEGTFSPPNSGFFLLGNCDKGWLGENSLARSQTGRGDPTARRVFCGPDRIPLGLPDGAFNSH